MMCKGGSVCVRECGECQIGGRERRGEREQRKKEREREKEGEGAGVLSLFIQSSFYPDQGMLHFISVFGLTVMTWKHLNAHNLSLSLSLSQTSISNVHPSIILSLSLSTSIFVSLAFCVFIMSEILFEMVWSFIVVLSMYWERGPKLKNEKKWRVWEREWEKEWKRGMEERILSFFLFNIFFFTSDTSSLRCLQWISGVDVL